MPASLRSAITSEIDGSFGPANAPLDTQEGDLLLAFHTADSGTLANMTISGGGDWQPLASRAGGNWAGTEIWQKVAGPDEPSLYGVSQGIAADGTVIIAAIKDANGADITVVQTDGVTAPAATPAGASGLELRYATGVPQGQAIISWSAPTGYAVTQRQATPWTSSCLAVRPFSSSSPLGAVALTPSEALFVSHSFTILIGSSEPTPEPEKPTYPPFAPSRGSAPYTYYFRRLLDGVLLGQLDLANVGFDKRIGQAGAFQATIPIPSRRIADQVADIIPRTPADLSIGPGVIVCDIWRDGVPWGEYWITGARPARSRRGTPTIQIRGSTLDAYLLHVELQADLNYVGLDQLDIARSLISHMQSQTGANLGLTLQAGTSGVLRDHRYTADEGTYGQRLAELGQLDNGFEWMINIGVNDGVITREWVYGYPKLGESDPQHVFTDSPHGGDIVEWAEEIDALRGATRWRARGASVSADASTTSTPLISTVHEATAHLAAGWPRLDKTINRSTVTELQTLEDYAAYWAATAPGALRVDSITVAIGAEPSFTPNSLGDTARIFFNNEWHQPHSRVRRIIGMAITPTSRQDGKEEAQLILEGQEDGG